MMKKYLILTFLLLIVGKSYTQDLHYTQFYNTPMNFNPSLTGIFNGDQRYMLSVRDQWRALPIPYFTLTGAYDMKFFPKQLKKSFFSAGVVFNYDMQGDSKLNLSNLNLAGSYSYMLSKRNLISVGALLGVASKGFSDNSLEWDAQYDPNTGFFDDRRPSLESISSRRFSYLETGLGVNYRYQKHSRLHFTVGAAGFHLTQPAQNFYEGIAKNRLAKLGIRYALHGVANFKIAGPLDIQANILYQGQGEYEELVAGGILKIYINQQRGKMFEFHLGSSFRFTDAIIPTIAVQYNDWYVGFNYDLTTSELDEYVNQRGGPELHIKYIFKSVAPLKAFKICPIF